jgi:hypothetical protein
MNVAWHDLCRHAGMRAVRYRERRPEGVRKVIE